jgi:YesN/AraC family two-component response regulator
LKLQIKYMVSNRCKIAVREALNKHGLHFVIQGLGVVEVMEELSGEVKAQVKIDLMKSGLELMDDKKAMLVEKIRNVIVEMVHYADELPKTNFSVYLSEKLQYDYTYLANLFSDVTGMTIEHQIIAHKIERAKELLFYEELNLTQVSYKLGYSSVAHLSNQFKKVTGLTPTHFMKLKDKSRNPIEDI